MEGCESVCETSLYVDLRGQTSTGLTRANMRHGILHSAQWAVTPLDFTLPAT